LYKDRGCGEIGIDQENKEITIAGWVDSWRDHGSLLFIDLRDSTGTVQVVFDKSKSDTNHQIASSFRTEWVIQVKGKVEKRIEGAENPNIATGYIEVHANEIKILNESKTPPFEVNSKNIDETTRLRYRFLDLRSSRMQKNIRLRNDVVLSICNFLNNKDFVHIETPILIKSTPEGARDYVVPSRVHPGEFYALPQSPQQIKQMLMTSGFEKYYQIAKCFRDEDLRADRQPEHTQLDFEMSFVHQEDVLSNCEELYYFLSQKYQLKDIIYPFPRITYEESMERYGTDKPDTRFSLELKNLNGILSGTEFRVFNNVLDSNGSIKGISLKNSELIKRSYVDELNNFVIEMGGGGVIPISLENVKDISELKIQNVKSPISKFLNEEHIKEIYKTFNASEDDIIFISAGETSKVNECLGSLRNKLAKDLGLIDQSKINFLFVTNFPLFEMDKDSGKWIAMHHVFSSPTKETEGFLDSDPGKVIGNLFDLVCNGVELGSGSIRIHNRKIQEKVFSIIGYSSSEVEERFGSLLEAFEYGAPPHGGMGLGIDRLIAIFSGEDSIRDVISFPKTQSASDLLWGAPSLIEEDQKKQLNLKIIDKEKG
tara:strand:- start:7517 stop:9310 length:1794 start_codon:yes stop_codon:yes gene_type:complete